MSASTATRYRKSTGGSTPTKRCDEANNSFTEEYVLDDIAKEAAFRSQQQREQNREARQIRHKELEKSVLDDNDEHSPSTPPSPSIPIEYNKYRMININGKTETTENSSLLQKFLNGDVDPRTLDQRDLRRLLSELESKYKSLMITNSSMYNEKQALRYELDTLKDILAEHYEILNQTKRQLKEKCKDFDSQRQILIDLEENHKQLKEVLINCETIIQEAEMKAHIGQDQNYLIDISKGLKSSEILLSVNSLYDGSIYEKLSKILNQKHERVQEVIKLKSELDETKNHAKTLKERIKSLVDLQDQNTKKTFDDEHQKQLLKQITDLNNRLLQLAAENGSLQKENIRYEAQLTRYKQQLDDAERVETELKQERLQLHRELRLVSDDLENERARGILLQRRNERLRSLHKKDLFNNNDEKIDAFKSHLPLLPTNSNERQFKSPSDDST